MKRIVDILGRATWAKQALAVFVLCAATAIALPAQTFATPFAFDGTDGASPLAPLIQGIDGNLYGTTQLGGAHGAGTVFKITLSGMVTTLYSFCSQGDYCPDGSQPYAALVQGVDGDFYGTTSYGGTNCAPNGCGTVFKITPSGTLTTLYSFCPEGLYNCTDGAGPLAALVRAPNGDLYGTTSMGGQYSYRLSNYGTVFKITPGGTLTTLYEFCPQGAAPCADGNQPNGLVQATDGDFYGTTMFGGAGNQGTVFKITPSGTLTTLYSFCPEGLYNCTDGLAPIAGLTQAANGDFYGTTGGGGAGNQGTVFKITQSGALTTLYSFCSQGVDGDCTDGAHPTAPLVQASHGDFYGTTASGGSGGNGGTIFTITPSGTLTTLHSFCLSANCRYSAYPSGLVQSTNGEFYGAAGYGGEPCPYFRYGCGTIFSLSVGLGPFVETQTTFGQAGSAVNILGTDLTGATSVSFNGATAVFTVVSATEITATVPAGATTGKLEVVTPSGTLSSNVPFEVIL